MMADTNKENLPAVPAMKLELVPVPVSDVDRARAFYIEKAGFTLDVDTRPTGTLRVVHLKPPGSVKGLQLVVADIHPAREALVKRGLEVAEVWDIQGVKYAGFSDPDGNSWLLQEFPAHLRS